MSNAARSPWRMFLPLALVLLIAILWSGYWFVALGNVKSRLAEQRAALAAQGLTLACTKEGWGGYPFHFEFSCTSPILNFVGKAELRSANLLLVALAYAPWQIAALVDGPTSVMAQGIAPTEVRHQRALAAVTFDKAWQASVSAEVPKISVSGIGTADKLLAFTRPAGVGGTEIAIKADGVNMQTGDKPPIAIDNGSLKGTLQQDHVFKIDSISLHQGALRVDGAGTIALDSQHRLSGEIGTETNDSNALLSLIGPQLGLSEGQVANLRTVLGLLGNEAKAALIARDGALFFGPFQIAQLSPIY